MLVNPYSGVGDVLCCPAVLASPRDRSSVEAALSVLPGLVSSQPPDLAEVSVELARVLLHLQDSWDLPALPSLRHSTLVALTIARPRLLAPYLTAEFYSSNHNTRQRLDLLEVPTPRSSVWPRCLCSSLCVCR